jgi:hypothetical protein
MQAGDWASAAVNVVIGVLLGIAIHDLAALFLGLFWPLSGWTIHSLAGFRAIG